MLSLVNSQFANWSLSQLDSSLGVATVRRSGLRRQSEGIFSPFQTSSNVKIGGALYKQPWWFMKFHIFKSITVFK